MYKALVLIALINSLKLHAQSSPSPYGLHWGLETGITATALGTNLAYFFMSKKIKPLDTASLALLDPMNVPRFDRLPTRLWSRPVAKVSDGLLYTSFAVPAILFIDKDIRRDYLKVGAIWAQTFALTAGLTNLTKAAVHRTRPFNYNPHAPLEYKMRKDARFSFFSGHTSMTAAMSFMTAKIYTDYHPRSRALPWVWASAAIVPAVTAILRVRAGKHFPSDVLIGYAVGAAVGVLVPTVHRWIRQ